MKTLLQNPVVADPRVILGQLSDSADISIHELAALLGCCVDHVGRLCKAGKFVKPHRLGRIRRWNLGVVRRFLRDQAEKANS